MALKHMVLHKKIEELEADIDSLATGQQFVSADDDGNNKKIDRVSRKINFVKKLLADVAGTYSQDNRPEDLDDMADRLSVVENKFNDWTADQDGNVDGSMSPCSCTSSCLNEDDGEEEQETGDEEKDDTEQCSTVVADYPEYDDGVISNTSDEKMRFQAFLSQVNLEDLILKLAEKENSKKRRKGRWFRMVGTMGVGAVLAIGVLIAWFGSMEEGVYLVPT